VGDDDFLVSALEQSRLRVRDDSQTTGYHAQLRVGSSRFDNVVTSSAKRIHCWLRTVVHDLDGPAAGDGGDTSPFLKPVMMSANWVVWVLSLSPLTVLVMDWEQVKVMCR
jgi:hypothetical protein